MVGDFSGGYALFFLRRQFAFVNLANAAYGGKSFVRVVEHMFTYNMESLVIEGNADKPTFPSVVSYSITFNPTIPFGIGKGKSRIVFGQSEQLNWDLETGKFYSETQEGTPIEVEAKWENVPFRFAGSTVSTTMQIDNDDTFTNIFEVLYWYLPVTLGFHMREPLRIEKFEIEIEGKKFSVKKKALPEIVVYSVTKQEQEQRASQAILDLDLLYRAGKSLPSNRPIFVAMHYYLVAQKLILAGNSTIEFLPEILLNYAKVLEAFWGSSRESIREGLTNTGIDHEEIECVFVPVCLLRNSLDIAHAVVSKYQTEQLNKLRTHVQELDIYFRNLIERILDNLAQGKVTYRECNSEKYNSELDRIINSLEKRPQSNYYKESFLMYRVGYSEINLNGGNVGSD